MLRIIVLLVIFSSCLQAQKEDHQWVFHFSSVNDTVNYPEWTASILDFNTLPPRAIRNTDITMDFLECHACLCDENGKLLLYSNGNFVQKLIKI